MPVTGILSQFSSIFRHALLYSIPSFRKELQSQDPVIYFPLKKLLEIIELKFFGDYSGGRGACLDMLLSLIQ